MSVGSSVQAVRAHAGPAIERSPQEATKMAKQRSLILGLTMLAVGFTAPAWARGAHGGGGGFGGGGHVFEELIFPCRAACSETARGCFETASSTASSCIASACSAQVTAAQDACKGGRSTTCRSAVSALRECGESCLDTRAGAAEACRSDRNTCVAACDAAG
jgi:hypothetical protein